MALKSVNKPALLAADGKSALGKTFDIPPEGLELLLCLPEGCELGSATLSLHTGAASEVQLTCDLTSDKGPMHSAFTEAVNWLIADWQAERPAHALEISSRNSEGVNARVKVFQSGVWVPQMPVDIMATGSKQHFSPVITSKLMAEFVKKSQTPGLWDPAPIEVKQTKVYASLAPYDLGLAVADREPFFSHQGALSGSEPITVTGFKEAVNSYLSDTDDTEISLKITASMPARINVKKFEAVPISLIKTLEGLDDQGRLSLSWDGEAAASAIVGADAEITDVQFEFTTDLLPERMLLAPDSTETSRACLVDTGYGAAQGFDALPAGTVLSGLDLYLSAAQSPVKGTLDLCPDDMGRPAGQPFPGASKAVELGEQGNGYRTPRWVAFHLSQPLTLLTDPWWAVLSVAEGEIHWLLAEEAPEGVSGTMYRVAGGPWLKRTAAEDGQPMWGLARLRAHLPGPAAPAASLRRSKQVLPVEPDARGQVKVTVDALRVLNQRPAAARKDLELVFTSEAAGSVIITKPCIKFKPKESQ